MANVSLIPLPEALWWFSTTYVAVLALLGLVLNCLLIAAVLTSPSLRCPSNFFLVNLAANNLVLVITQFLMLVCLLTRSAGAPVRQGPLRIPAESFEGMAQAQSFLLFFTVLKYWHNFVFVVVYRARTLRQPRLNLEQHRTWIARSTITSWILSFFVATLLFSVFNNHLYFSCVIPVRAFYPLTSDEFVFDHLQSLLLTALAVLLLLGVLILVIAYCKLSATLAENHLAMNRISHAELPYKGARRRTQSLSDLFVVSMERQPGDVHGQPRRATQYRLASPVHVPMQQLRSTSLPSDDVKLPQLKFIPRLFSNRDHSQAARNTTILLLLFLAVSLPHIISIIPPWNGSSTTSQTHLLRISFRLLFCLNSIVYPLWFITSSKLVRVAFRELGRRVCGTTTRSQLS